MKYTDINFDKNALILFDGECMFCNKTIQFILKNDKKEHFLFAALQLLQYFVPVRSVLHFHIVSYGPVTVARGDCARCLGFWKPPLLLSPKACC